MLFFFLANAVFVIFFLYNIVSERHKSFGIANYLQHTVNCRLNVKIRYSNMLSFSTLTVTDSSHLIINEQFSWFSFMYSEPGSAYSVFVGKFDHLHFFP